MPTAPASGVQLHTTGGFITMNTASSNWGNILYNTTITTAIRQRELLNLMLWRLQPQVGDTAHSENELFFKSRLLSINVRRARMEDK
jgi:hypothetical protein